MPKKIYFDYNVINYLRQGANKKLNEKFCCLDDDSLIVFSPAHLEEIAVSEKRYNVNKNIIREEIGFLKKIAKNHSLRRISEERLVLFNEYPEDCYRRVIKGYSYNDIAEKIEADVIRDANKNPLGNPKNMNNISPDEVLHNIIYREMIARELNKLGLIKDSEVECCIKWNFSDLKEDKHYVFETYVNLAANLLEKIGYFRESKSSSRSRLHDVSHIIYAAYSDIFVSSDKKLLAKSKAIYSMLKISVKVLSTDEFISN